MLKIALSRPHPTNPRQPRIKSRYTSEHVLDVCLNSLYSNILHGIVLRLLYRMHTEIWFTVRLDVFYGHVRFFDSVSCY